MIGKEKITLAATVAVLGLVGYLAFPDAESAPAKPNEKGIEIPKFPVPDLSRVRLAPTKPAARGSRDIFAAPRDVEPLPDLALAPPPPPHLAIVAPPLLPGVGLARWSDFYRVPSDVHPFDFSAAAASEEAKKADSGKPAAAAPGSSEDRAAKNEAYKKLYDWLRLNPTTYVWGRIQNPNRFELGYPKLRETESILLQEIDPDTGKQKGKPTPWAAERVQEYGFADTIANQVEIRKRRISYTAGNIAEIIAFADWCVEQGAEEPKGFLEAERVYRLAAKLDPGDPAGPLGLGRLYERSFQLEEAYEIYREMSEGRFAHRAEPFLHLGKLQARLRMFALAEASLRRAVEIDNVFPFSRAALCEFYLERGRAEEAVETLRSAKMEAPAAADRARIRTTLGEALLAAGAVEEAVETFKQALNTMPDRLDASVGLAAALYAKGDFAEGLRIVDAAIAKGSISTDLYTARALFGLRLGNYAAAERDLKSAIGLNPLRDYYPLAALGFLYETTGHLEEAAQSIEAAYTIDPTDAYVRYERARLAAAREDLQGAREGIAAVLGSEIRFKDGVIFRGLLADLADESESAERYYAFACDLDSKNADLFALRGLNLAKGGQIRRALEVFQKALSLDADQPSALNGLGFCAYADGRPDDAIRGFADVVDRHKQDDEHHGYADARLKEIQDHLTKVVWSDRFDRTDLRRDWKDEARVGPLVKLENNAVMLEGLSREAGRTRLFQEIPGRAFISIEVVVTVEEANQSLAGLQVVAEKKVGDTTHVDFEIDIARSRSGKVVTRVQNGQIPPEWKVWERLSWPVGQPVKLAIERVGTAEEPKIRIRFNGEPVDELEKLQRLKSIAGDVRIGVFAESEPGRQVSVRLDEVRLVKREK